MTNAAPGDHQERSASWEFAASETLSIVVPSGPQENAADEQSCGDSRDDACEEAIRVLAYFKWEAAGSPEGDGVDYWLEAEREVKANPGRSTPAPG